VKRAKEEKKKKASLRDGQCPASPPVVRGRGAQLYEISFPEAPPAGGELQWIGSFSTGRSKSTRNSARRAPLEASLSGGRIGSLPHRDGCGGTTSGQGSSVSSKSFSPHLRPPLFPSPIRILYRKSFCSRPFREGADGLVIQKATLSWGLRHPRFQICAIHLLKERESKQRKAHRWQDIAIKAVQQSRRAHVRRSPTALRSKRS